MMEITLNNRPETLPQESITVSELIKLKNFSFRLLVTRVNGKLVKKDERERVVIREGDDVMILHMISGG